MTYQEGISCCLAPVRMGCLGSYSRFAEYFPLCPATDSQLPQPIAAVRAPSQCGSFFGFSYPCATRAAAFCATHLRCPMRAFLRFTSRVWPSVATQTEHAAVICAALPVQHPSHSTAVLL